MDHITHNVFKTVNGIVNRSVHFISDMEGEIDRLEIQWDRSTDPIVFKRQE